MQEHTGRIRFSVIGVSLEEAYARLDALIRKAAEVGLAVEEAGIDNPSAQDITPDRQPRPSAS